MTNLKMIKLKMIVLKMIKSFVENFSKSQAVPTPSS